MKIPLWLLLCILPLAGIRADINTRVDEFLQAGNYAAALPLLLELQAQHENPRTLSEKSAAAAHALALGQTHRQLKSLDDAESSLRRAETLVRKLSDPDLLGSVLMELAEIKPESSESYLEEAWQVWRRCDKTPELAATARLRFAEIRLSQANYAASKSLLTESLDWLDQPHAKSRAECLPVRARAFQNIGRWHLVMGDHQTALEFLDQSLELKPGTSQVMADRALALWRAGHSDEAQAAFQEAGTAANADVRRGIRANHAAAILSWLPPDATPEVVLSTASHVVSLVDFPVTSSSATLTLAEAHRLASLAKAQLGQSAADSQAACASTLEQLQGRSEFTALRISHPLRRHASAVRWMLEAMRSPDEAQPFAQAVIASSVAQLDSLDTVRKESARIAFLDPLDIASPLLALPAAERIKNVPALLSVFGLAARIRKPVPHSLAEWQSALPAQSAMVAYFIFRKPVGFTWMNSVALLILSPSDAPQLIDLEVAADNFLRKAHQLRDQTTSSPDTMQQTLSKFGTQLWKPLTSRLPMGTTRVFVFLEGALTIIPLACLRVNDVSVLDGPLACSFIADPETLFHGAAKHFPIRPGLRLATDAKDVPKEIPEPGDGWNFPYTILDGRKFGFLANVGKELDDISSAFPGEWRRMVAQENVIRKELIKPKVRLWHFAGHGLAESNFQPGPAMAYGNCLVCSGVDPTKPPAMDGLLFAGEIAEMKLDGLDLAVLSACDTGRGAVRRGEAVFDLARACHRAGVRDVLVSAAPVQDAVAPALMKEFYLLLASGEDAATAAWKAQRKLYLAHPSLHSVGYFRLIRGNSSRL